MLDDDSKSINFSVKYLSLPFVFFEIWRNFKSILHDMITHSNPVFPLYFFYKGAPVRVACSNTRQINPARGWESYLGRRLFENLKFGQIDCTAPRQIFNMTWKLLFCKHFRRENFKWSQKSFSNNVARRFKRILSKFCSEVRKMVNPCIFVFAM
jgi:hypothetical protein